MTHVLAMEQLVLKLPKTCMSLGPPGGHAYLSSPPTPDIPCIEDLAHVESESLAGLSLARPVYQILLRHERGVPFDWVVRARPDMFFSHLAPLSKFLYVMFQD